MNGFSLQMMSTGLSTLFGMGLETKLIILHSKIGPFGSNFDDCSSVIRCLKSTSWNFGGTAKMLEQPQVLGGLSAAALTLAELKHQAALLVCCFSPTSDIDSVSLRGFSKTISNINLKKELPDDALSFLPQDVIKSRLKKLHQRPP